ncbi:MAG: hypothetical protein MR371_04855 [Clostridia bacterium]|nr:hypothetical protein [Clostridia bacterium]
MTGFYSLTIIRGVGLDMTLESRHAESGAGTTSRFLKHYFQRGDSMTKREEFLIALMEEPTVTRAYKRAGISKTKAYAFLGEDSFKSDINRLKSEILSSVTSYLQSNLAECSETLMAIIRSDSVSAQVKINAAQVVFSTCRALTETTDILPRLEALEEATKRND